MDETIQPIDTSHVTLSVEICGIAEILARHAHDIWATQRLSEGWTWGPRRDDAAKQHPNLVPYERLGEEEKEYDRRMVTQALSALYALGYRIEKH